MGDRLTTRFDWGIPLTDINLGDRTLQEQVFIFRLITVLSKEKEV